MKLPLDGYITIKTLENKTVLTENYANPVFIYINTQVPFTLVFDINENKTAF